MAVYRRAGRAVMLVGCIAAGSANAQALQRSDVLGEWTLRLTPAEGGEGRVTVETDSGRLEMPLVVIGGSSDLACIVDDEPADCRLRRGAFIVTLRMDAARMIYTLNGRRGDGFTGDARMTLPLLPFGRMAIGTVAMTRRD